MAALEQIGAKLDDLYTAVPVGKLVERSDVSGGSLRSVMTEYRIAARGTDHPSPGSGGDPRSRQAREAGRGVVMEGRMQ